MPTFSALPLSSADLLRLLPKPSFPPWKRTLSPPVSIDLVDLVISSTKPPRMHQKSTFSTTSPNRSQTPPSDPYAPFSTLHRLGQNFHPAHHPPQIHQKSTFFQHVANRPPTRTGMLPDSSPTLGRVFRNFQDLVGKKIFPVFLVTPLRRVKNAAPSKKWSKTAMVRSLPNRLR